MEYGWGLGGAVIPFPFQPERRHADEDNAALCRGAPLCSCNSIFVLFISPFRILLVNAITIMRPLGNCLKLQILVTAVALVDCASINAQNDLKHEYDHVPGDASTLLRDTGS